MGNTAITGEFLGSTQKSEWLCAGGSRQRLESLPADAATPEKQRVYLDLEGTGRS